MRQGEERNDRAKDKGIVKEDGSEAQDKPKDALLELSNHTSQWSNWTLEHKITHTQDSDYFYLIWTSYIATNTKSNV